MVGEGANQAHSLNVLAGQDPAITRARIIGMDGGKGLLPGHAFVANGKTAVIAPSKISSSSRFQAIQNIREA